MNRNARRVCGEEEWKRQQRGVEARGERIGERGSEGGVGEGEGEGERRGKGRGEGRGKGRGKGEVKRSGCIPIKIISYSFSLNACSPSAPLCLMSQFVKPNFLSCLVRTLI